MLLTLLSIIQKDESINSEHKEDFKTFFSISKEDLLQVTTFHLSEFLGQMLLYTTCSNIENKTGKPFVREITIDYIENIAKDCPVKRTDMEWLGINESDLFPNKYKPVELGDFKAKKILNKLSQYKKIANKFMEVLVSRKLSNEDGQIIYPTIPDEELKALRQQLNELYIEIYKLYLFPHLFASDKNDIEK